MATKNEIETHLEIALKEIGKIEPWFDKDVKAWVFEHPNYPVGYAGKSANEVIKKYPLHLKEFIKERLHANLDPLIEKKTKGHGGARPGAGRPVGSIKEPTRQIRVPVDIAQWLKKPGIFSQVRKLEDFEGIKKTNPRQQLTDPNLVGQAFFECLLENDPEGALEMIQIYLEAKAKPARLKHRNPTMKTLAKIMYASTH